MIMTQSWLFWRECNAAGLVVLGFHDFCPISGVRRVCGVGCMVDWCEGWRVLLSAFGPAHFVEIDRRWVYYHSCKVKTESL